MTVTAVAIIAAGGVGALRYGWSHPERRVSVVAGWAAIAIAVLWLGTQEGAWGVSIASIVVMLGAMVPLLYAAARDPRRAARPARTGDVANDSGIRLHAGGASGIARRIATFLITVPGAGAASLLVALAGQAAARGAGWHEANSITLGLLLLPVTWAILSLWLLMYDRPAAMLARLGIAAAPAALIFLLLR